MSSIRRTVVLCSVVLALAAPLASCRDDSTSDSGDSLSAADAESILVQYYTDEYQSAESTNGHGHTWTVTADDVEVLDPISVPQRPSVTGFPVRAEVTGIGVTAAGQQTERTLGYSTETLFFLFRIPGDTEWTVETKDDDGHLVPR